MLLCRCGVVCAAAQELAEAAGVTVDVAGFEVEMEAQRQRSKDSRWGSKSPTVVRLDARCQSGVWRRGRWRFALWMDTLGCRLSCRGPRCPGGKSKGVGVEGGRGIYGQASVLCAGTGQQKGSAGQGDGSVDVIGIQAPPPGEPLGFLGFP